MDTPIYREHFYFEQYTFIRLVLLLPVTEINPEVSAGKPDYFHSNGFQHGE